MKRLFACIVCLLLVASTAWGAASSWSVSYSPAKTAAGTDPLIKSWSATFVGSGSDGNVTSYTTTASDIAFMKDYFLYVLEVDPGATPPTAGWDIAITDSLGLEIGTMSDFSATVSEKRYFTATSDRWYPPRDSTALVIGVSGTTAPSGSATLKFWLSK